MKVLIVRPFPSMLDVRQNTYNIQEIGLAKALNRRGCLLQEGIQQTEKCVVSEI